MSQISSINFKKSVSFQVFHNSTVRPNYAIGGELIANRKGYEALKLKEQIIENAKEAYMQNCKARNKKFQATSYEWSAVCNIKEDTTMQDLERLAKHFETKYGFQCYQIAIHRDEGHIDDNGEKVINHHAHLEFITLDKYTGKSMFRAELQRAKALRQIQDEVAEILNMERGVDKRISKRERVEPRKYAQMKEQERKNTQKLKQDIKTKDNVIQAKNQVIQTQDQTLNEKNEELAKLKQKLILTQEQIQEIINQALTQQEAEIEKIKQEARERERKIKEILYSKIDKLEADIKEKDKVIQDQEQELEQEKLSKAELKKELEKLRQNSKNQGFSKEFFQEINLEKKKLRFDNKKELEQWFQKLVEQHTKKGILSNKVDNEAIFEEMYKVYKKPYEKIEAKDQEIANLKAELKRSEAENNQARNKIQLLETKIKAEKFYDKNTEQSEQNQENNHTQEQNKPKIHKHR